MKSTFIFLISVACFMCVKAQNSTKGINPLAKKLNDSAVSIFVHSGMAPEKLDEELKLMDLALKTDSNYFDGWMNKMNFEGHFAKYDKALKTALKMEKLFPTEPQPVLCAGLLQYQLGKKTEATASFNKVLKQYNTLITKFKTPKIVQALKIRKGITLILLDKTYEGKQLLTDIYNKEADDVTKSYIGFYVNSSKDDIVKDMLPGS